jgi:hypothetical protein
MDRGRHTSARGSANDDYAVTRQRSARFFESDWRRVMISSALWAI